MQNQEQNQRLYVLCQNFIIFLILCYRENRTKLSTFLSPSYILIPDCWWRPDSPGKTHKFEEEVQLKRSMTNFNLHVYAAFFQYWSQLLSQLCFLTAMFLSPAVYRSAVVSIACVNPYIVTWKFQICGNMANEMRNYFRKLPWGNKEEVCSLVCNSVYQWNVFIALLVLVKFLNALCAYGGCSFSFQIWCLETHKAGKLLKL